MCWRLPWSRKGSLRKLTIEFNNVPIQQFLISSKEKIMIDQSMVTTNIELSGFRVVKNLGVVRGITVRSVSWEISLAASRLCLAARFPFT